jgi:hypothetical protein
VYYDTYLTDEPEEAIRLMNVSDSPVDLSGWTVTDGEGTIALESSLDARESIWIAREAASFALEFGFSPDYEYDAETAPLSPTLHSPAVLRLPTAETRSPSKTTPRPRSLGRWLPWQITANLEANG